MQSQNTPAAYFVRSSGNPNAFYLLQTDGNGTLVCSCKAALYSRKPCRHVRAVIAGQALVAQPKRRPAPEERAVTVSTETRDRLDLLQV